MTDSEKDAGSTDSPNARPQARQSRRRIKRALLMLMGRESLGSITVTEVAEQAEVSRRTFYRHFASVDEAFVEAVRDVALDFSTFYFKGIAERGHSFDSVVYLHFAFWSERQAFLRTVLVNGRFFTVMDINCTTLLEKVQSAGLAFDERAEAAFRFCTGGIWLLIEQWAHEGFAETPDQMVDRCHAIPQMIR